MMNEDQKHEMDVIRARMNKELRAVSEQGSVVDYILSAMRYEESHTMDFPISDEEAYYGTNV